MTTYRRTCLNLFCSKLTAPLSLSLLPTQFRLNKRDRRWSYFWSLDQYKPDCEPLVKFNARSSCPKLCWANLASEVITNRLAPDLQPHMVQINYIPIQTLLTRTNLSTTKNSNLNSMFDWVPIENFTANCIPIERGYMGRGGRLQFYRAMYKVDGRLEIFRFWEFSSSFGINKFDDACIKFGKKIQFCEKETSPRAVGVTSTDYSC